MINIPELKVRMIRNDMSAAKLASETGINIDTLYGKLRSGRFNVEDAEKIAKALKFSKDDICDIFFA